MINGQDTTRASQAGGWNRLIRLLQGRVWCIPLVTIIVMASTPGPLTCSGSSCSLDAGKVELMALCEDKGGCQLCDASCIPGSPSNRLECVYACGGATCPPD